MADLIPADLELTLWAEQDLHLRTHRYREAIAWWNGNYAVEIYRQHCARELRERRRNGDRPHRSMHLAWHRENRSSWFFLRRFIDASDNFPHDRDRWRRLGVRDAARILLITVLVTRPDFDGSKVGLHEEARWSDGDVLDDDQCFGRDWGDGGTSDRWDEETGDNRRWLDLAHAARRVMESAATIEQQMPSRPDVVATPAPQMPQTIPMNDPHELARFTDAQRSLFHRVSERIRSEPASFREAGRWLDAGAGIANAAERAAQVRRHWLSRARSRRQVGRGYLVPDGPEPLTVRRNMLAQHVRAARSHALAAPSQLDVLQVAATSLLSNPPNYDGLRSDLAEIAAWRVLLVVWLLTDTRELHTSPSITRLQSWDWGVSPIEFLGDWPDGDMRPIPRSWARKTLLDRDIEHWEHMASEALHYLELTQSRANGTEAVMNSGERTRRKGGRPKLCSQEERRRNRIVQEWQRAKEAKTPQKVFCEDQNISLEYLNKAVNWFIQRQRRMG